MNIFKVLPPRSFHNSGSKSSGPKAKKEGPILVEKETKVTPETIREKVQLHSINKAKGKEIHKNKFKSDMPDDITADMVLGMRKANLDRLKAETDAKAEVISETKMETAAKAGVASDVGKNDPQDDTTRDKLMGVLNQAAFVFNPKEKEVLDSILNQKSDS